MSLPIASKAWRLLLSIRYAGVSCTCPELPEAELLCRIHGLEYKFGLGCVIKRLLVVALAPRVRARSSSMEDRGEEHSHRLGRSTHAPT